MICSNIKWYKLSRYALLLFVPLVYGCGGGEYPTVLVSGVVTFDGGECPGSGNVTFQPLKVDEGMPNRPASGQFGKDGKYTISAFSTQKGVIPGLYRVEVTCISGVPDSSKADPWGDVNYIDSSYKSSNYKIESDSPSVTYDIDVPRKK